VNETRTWKDAIKLGMGKLVTRLQDYAAQYQDSMRRRHIATICRIDHTVTIGSTTGFLNSRGNPDDITVGASSAVLGELIVFPQGGKIRIGERCFVGKDTRIWSAASISIGNYVLIAHNVNIHDNISHSLFWRERREEIDNILSHSKLYAHSFNLQQQPMVVEDDVWIGFGASIIGGVRIGRGAIVGANTMVTKDVPPFTLVVGNPMRVVRQLSDNLEPRDA
jgi:acetyltransferase-like isoleucine patch superfamily enzyme